MCKKIKLEGSNNNFCIPFFMENGLLFSFKSVFGIAVAVVVVI
jgi:hypothetical protein